LAGCCERGDEPSGSGATESVIRQPEQLVKVTEKTWATRGRSPIVEVTFPLTARQTFRGPNQPPASCVTGSLRAQLCGVQVAMGGCRS
jgi:hypothetical protein